MNGRTQENQNLHDDLVRKLAKHYSSLGYIGVRTDLPGATETPGSIYWEKKPDTKYIPDITCYKNNPEGTLIIAEVETCDTLSTDHTKEQWKIFFAHAKSKGGEFHIMTPKSCVEKAKSVAQELSITVHNYWWVG